MADKTKAQPGFEEAARLQAELESALARERASQETRRALLAMLEDIEESQREVELARREWLSAMDAVQDPIFMHDREYRVLRANRAYAERAGMDVRQVIGKPYWQLFPKLDGPLPCCVYALECRQGNEEELRLPSGEAFLVRYYSILDGEGNYLYSLHIMQDVTEKRRAEAEQRTLSEALRQAAEAVLVLDAEGNIQYLNPAFYRLFGYAPEDILGQPIFMLAVPEQDPSRQPPAVIAQLREHGRWQGEGQRLAKDGTAIPVLLNASTIRDTRGKITGFVGTYLDLREIKKAEGSLRESELRFRNLVETSSDWIWEVDAHGIYTYASPKILDILGYTPDEMVGKTPFDLMPPEEAERIKADFLRLATEKRPILLMENVNRHKDGRLVVLETNGVPILDAEGGLSGYRGMNRDITMRKQAEARLRLFHDLLDQSTDGIFIVDPATSRFLDVNEAACRDLRYTREELLQRGVVDVQNRICDAAAWQAHLQELRAKEQTLFEFDALRKDGSQFPVEISVRDVTVGDQTYIIAVVRDITARKQVEAQLRLFRDLLDNSNDAIEVIDPATMRFLDVNEKGCRDLGYSREELLSMSVLDIDPTFGPADMKMIDEQVQKSGAALFERLHRRKDKSTFPVEISLRFVEIGKSYVLSIARDITERKKAEMALHRALRAQQALSACNAILIHATEEKQLLADMCRTVIEQSDYRLAWIGYAEYDVGKCVRPVASAGYEEGCLESLQITWADSERGQGPTGRAVRLGTPQMAEDILTDPQYAPWRELALQHGYAANIALPLKEEGGKVFGVLNIYAAEAHAFDEAEIRLLQELADDLSFGVRTLRTRRERDHYQLEHLKSADRLKESLIGTIRAIALTVEKRDPYTAGHQSRVADLAAAIARELGLDADHIEGLRLGAMIHDIGKIYIPAEILNRPGRLTAPEFEMIKSHSEVGYDIIKDVKFPWPVADMVLQHHERLDGSGYPKGIKGEEIILEARILAVADVVEAITAHRPYRPALGFDKAFAEIEAKRGQFYDANVVDACLRLFREKGYRLGES